VTQVLSAVPLKYDQLAGVWNEKLCRRHRLFASDLKRIDEVLELGLRLKELRQGLASKDCGLISSAWQEQFRGLMKREELDEIREAMSKHFTGPNCIEDMELSPSHGDLEVRWRWLGASESCFVGVGDRSYPEPRPDIAPNAIRQGALRGSLKLSSPGSFPHVRIWPMFLPK
jgi:hypothetical protein